MESGKFSQNPLTDRLVFWVPPIAYTAKTPAPIFTINTSNDVVSRKDVLFGGLENKKIF